MEAIDIKHTDDHVQITLDKRAFDETLFLKTVEYLRMELLAQRVDFDESIETLADDLKRSWWKTNKSRFVPK